MSYLPRLIAAATLLLASDAVAQYHQARLPGDGQPSDYIIFVPSSQMAADYAKGTADYDGPYIKRAFPAAVVNADCDPSLHDYGRESPAEPKIAGTSIQTTKVADREARFFEETLDSDEDGMFTYRRLASNRITGGLANRGDASMTVVQTGDFWSVSEFKLRYRTSLKACNANFMIEMFDRIWRSVKYSPLNRSQETEASGGSGAAPASAGPVATGFGQLRSGVQAGAGNRERKLKERPGMGQPNAQDIAKRDAKLAALKAKSYFVSGSLLSAKEHLQRSLDANPASYESHFLFGSVMKLMGEPGKWEEHVAEARQLNARFDVKLVNMFRGGGLSKDEDRASGFVAKGLLHEAWDRTEKALDAYSAAISAAPGFWLGYAYRGILKAQLRDCAGAEDDLRRAGELNYLYKIHGRYWVARCKDPS